MRQILQKSGLSARTGVGPMKMAKAVMRMVDKAFIIVMVAVLV